jgi:RNA polymerase sigma-70 factor (ECF subfamily)
MLGRKKKEKERRFAEEALPHMDTLYRGAFYLTKRESEADDLVQETYLKAFKKFDSFQAGTNCKAWLYRIMTNTFLNSKRKSKRVDSFVDNNSPGDYEAYIRNPTKLTRMDPEASFLHRTLSPAVKEALDSLPPDFRAAVILCDLQEFTYKEVAEILGCPTGTVMSRIYRGRNLLKKKLVEHAIESGLLIPQSAEESKDAPASLEGYRMKRNSQGGGQSA